MRTNYDLNPLNIAITNFIEHPEVPVNRSGMTQAVLSLYQEIGLDVEAADDINPVIIKAVSCSPIVEYKISEDLYSLFDKLLDEFSTGSRETLTDGIITSRAMALSALCIAIESAQDAQGSPSSANLKEFKLTEEQNRKLSEIYAGSEAMRSKRAATYENLTVMLKRRRILQTAFGVLSVAAALTLAAFAALIVASLILGAPIAIPLVGAVAAAIAALHSVSIAIPVVVAAVAAIGAVAGILTSVFAFKAARAGVFQLFAPSVRAKALDSEAAAGHSVSLDVSGAPQARLPEAILAAPVSKAVPSQQEDAAAASNLSVASEPSVASPPSANRPQSPAMARNCGAVRGRSSTIESADKISPLDLLPGGAVDERCSVPGPSCVA